MRRWVTESVQGGEETKEMCAKVEYTSILKYYLLCLQVRKCNIVDETRTETTRVPERKCEKVPSTRRKCGTVTVPQPPMEVTRDTSNPSLYPAYTRAGNEPS